jgi:hypothetical protein
MRLPAQLFAPDVTPAESNPATPWTTSSGLRLSTSTESVAVSTPVAEKTHAVDHGIDAPRHCSAIAEVLHAAGFTQAAQVAARRGDDARAEEWESLAMADAALARTLEAHGTVGVPSVQLGEDGAPRFIVNAPDSEALVAAFNDEHRGNGVDTELRLFLDEAMAPGDRFVDFAPGLGFAVLTAATTAAGSAMAFVERSESEAALSASARMSACAERVQVRGPAMSDEWTIPATDGLVIVHAGAAAAVAPLLQALRAADPAVRLDAIAWRCGTLRDADYDAEGVNVAAAVLGVLGFQHFALAVGTQGVELVPTEAVASNTMIFSVGASFLARANA